MFLRVVWLLLKKPHIKVCDYSTLQVTSVKLFSLGFLLDVPFEWQFSFQDPATHIMEGIIDLHHDVFFYLIFILAFIFEFLRHLVVVFSYTETESNYCISRSARPKSGLTQQLLKSSLGFISENVSRIHPEAFPSSTVMFFLDTSFRRLRLQHRYDSKPLNDTPESLNIFSLIKNPKKKVVVYFYDCDQGL